MHEVVANLLSALALGPHAGLDILDLVLVVFELLLYLPLFHYNLMRNPKKLKVYAPVKESTVSIIISGVMQITKILLTAVLKVLQIVCKLILFVCLSVL